MNPGVNPAATAIQNALGVSSYLVSASIRSEITPTPMVNFDR